MKRFVCAIMVAALCLTGFMFSVSAEESTLNDKFKDYISSEYPENILDYDEAEVETIAEIDGWIIFREINLPIKEVLVYGRVDGYIFSGSEHSFYTYGAFAMKGDRIYTFEEAIENGLDIDKAVIPFYADENDSKSTFYIVREGDTNLDNVLNLRDLINMQKKIALFEIPNEPCRASYKFRSDNIYEGPNMMDVLNLQKYLAGIE